MEGYQYTATGSDSSPKVNFDVQDERLGLMPRAIHELFDAVQKQKTSGPAATAGAAPSEKLESVRVRCSYIQIYMEKVFDLLAPGGARVERGGDTAGRAWHSSDKASRQRRVRWDTRRGFFVENLEWVECSDAEQCLKALHAGVRNKIMASHMQNEASSRSHCIFQVEVEQTKETGAEAAGVHVSGASERVLSTLSLVDLAGSERQASTGARGAALKESIEINTSLFVLRKVIQALAGDGGRRGGATPHIPFRDSKLTSLLKHSLGGNSHTLMIACCSPSDAYVDENASTLEYASTAKRIANRPVVNEDANTRLIRKLKEQILSLKEQLAQAHMVGGLGRGGGGGNGGGGNSGGGGGGGNSGALSARGPPNSGRRAGPSPDARPSTSSHPFDTDYGRHLGEKVVESVGLLKRMVATNTQLRQTSTQAAEAAQAAERSNAALMQENGELRDRLEQLQELLARSNSGSGERAGGPLSSRSYDGSTPVPGPPTSATARSNYQSDGSSAVNPSWLSSMEQQQQREQPPPQQQRRTPPAPAPAPGPDGMDPMLAAALYGPLPGAGGGGGGAPPASASSQGRMHSAESLTHNIGAEASSLKAENDAMEQRLQALTASLDHASGGVLSSGASVRSSRENKRQGSGAASRNSTGLWEGPTVGVKRDGGGGVQNGRRRGTPGSGRGGAWGSKAAAPPNGVLMPTSASSANAELQAEVTSSSAELDALNGLLSQREALSRGRRS